MPVEWSGLSPGLLLSLDRTSAEPLRSQLERQLRDAIRTGRLTIDERLPSSRELAGTLGLSRGLVQDCYSQLQAEGYLATRVGSATRVAAGVSTAVTEAPKLIASARLDVDFASGVPDLASFPRDDWMWAMREASRSIPNLALDYGDPRGDAHLRDVIAGYLRRVRASAADRERIVVCSGFAQGLGLVLGALRGIGVGTVAYEDPGQQRTSSSAAARAGIEAVPVQVDDGGIDVAALAASGARAVLLTPAHQWPTGVVLAPDRRLELIEWATAHDAYIIEDDYDAEFRYDRVPIGSLQGLGADRVASLGTVSKSLAPSLRLGWVLCPPAIADAVAEEKLHNDRGNPQLDQLALATLIESGRYDKHLRRMRAVYAKRCEALSDALTRHAPGVRLSGLAAGFHAVLHLPDGADEQAVIAEARARSVGVYGMSTLRSSGATSPPQLVLGFGNTTERAIHQGIERIADLLS